MKNNDIGSNFEYADEAFTFKQIGELSGDAALDSAVYLILYV
ncbi:MAG: hypothetical protein ACI9B7_001007 [Oleispira sp.]|jgi:hypothetical protein